MHKHMLPWNSDKGAKLCKPGPLSQQVDEDNWIRCVWSLRPRDQSGSTSGQTHTHTRRHTHTHRKMRTPCRPSEAAAWLIKEAWHPYSSSTSRCRAGEPGSQPRAPSGKLSDLGTQTSFFPCTPCTKSQYHLQARSRTLWPVWNRHEVFIPASIVACSHLLGERTLGCQKGKSFNTLTGTCGDRTEFREKVLLKVSYYAKLTDVFSKIMCL